MRTRASIAHPNMSHHANARGRWIRACKLPMAYDPDIRVGIMAGRFPPNACGHRKRAMRARSDDIESLGICLGTIASISGLVRTRCVHLR
jgi:hypothetical protein